MSISFNNKGREIFTLEKIGEHFAKQHNEAKPSPGSSLNILLNIMKRNAFRILCLGEVSVKQEKKTLTYIPFIEHFP